MSEQVTYRLSRRASEVAELLKSTGLFDDAITAARFAMAYALKHHFDEIRPGEYTVDDTGGNTYNIGSLDVNGQISTLFSALYPGCTTPYLYARNLMIFGLAKLGERIEREGFQSISALL